MALHIMLEQTKHRLERESLAVVSRIATKYCILTLCTLLVVKIYNFYESKMADSLKSKIAISSHQLERSSQKLASW